MEAVLAARSTSAKCFLILPLSLTLIRQQNTMPGFKAFKDRMNLLHAEIIAAFKLKPFLMHESENIWAFKIANKHTMPVNCRSNRK